MSDVPGNIPAYWDTEDSAFQQRHLLCVVSFPPRSLCFIRWFLLFLGSVIGNKSRDGPPAASYHLASVDDSGHKVTEATPFILDPAPR